MAQLTPMMQQYFEIKNQHKDKILFFRLGDFYEMFFDDAITASKELEITLTGRDCGQEERAPMCGIPYHAAESYIARLIEKNYKVAICEQVEDPALAKGIVRREIIKIITPGTVIESSMLDERINNYLLCIHADSKQTALSYADLSTGEFYCTYGEISEATAVKNEISRINPAEIISNMDLQEVKDANITYNILDKRYFDRDACDRRIKKQFGVSSPEGLGIENEALIKSTGALLLYLDDIQKVSLNNINYIKRYSISNFMVLDQSTRRNLELSETIRGKSRKGALLSVIDRTSTAMGGRKLRSWLEKPLLSTFEIISRLDAVAELYDDFLKREEIKEYLKSMYDIERLSTRIALGSANGKDLIAFKNSIRNLPYIKSLLSDCTSTLLKSIFERMDVLSDLFSIIDASINEEPPFLLKEGKLIKDGYLPELDDIRSASVNGKQWIAKLEQEEKEKTGIKSLKIGFNKVFGYYIDITKSNLPMVPEYFIRKQTLSNSERYITPELKRLEDLVLGAEEKLIELEYQIFIQIRNEIAEHIKRIQQTASYLSDIDCLCSLAEVSQKFNYVRPEVNNDNRIIIENGRHPVVEAQDKELKFVPNNTHLDVDENRMLIITGPNMAGKSTYMRQVALITLLAQIGCFVPASKAEIGVVDRIFTRVGASDDLASGQSTFMVEMSELANIINNATGKSLIILDEIGRGTSTFDGLSIAWSVVEYIADKTRLGAKTLFATHYHELTELEDKIEGVKNYCILVEEKGKDIVFLRKIARGGAGGSYGIQVARLAGIPEPVLERSSEIISILQKSEKNSHTDVYVRRRRRSPVLSDHEPNLFNYAGFSLAEEIKSLDVANITPVQALNILQEMQEKASDITRNICSK
ncbi:MAG: DNA mismatch repair protein MutS [Clostridiaceae bacterium]|nr:DNA mismatch repair protein MutS [Clostridiaceae bacterium]